MPALIIGVGALRSTSTALVRAHFSDLHYRLKNLAEADRCFSAAVDRATALGAQAAVLSGDATGHALDLNSPSA